MFLIQTCLAQIGIQYMLINVRSDGFIMNIIFFKQLNTICVAPKHHCIVFFLTFEILVCPAEISLMDELYLEIKIDTATLLFFFYYQYFSEVN